MHTVKATWKNGHVVPDEPVNWPEGRRLVVLEEPIAEVEFMTEGEQTDDPASIQRWIDELRSIPPLPMTPAQGSGNDRVAAAGQGAQPRSGAEADGGGHPVTRRYLLDTGPAFDFLFRRNWAVERGRG